jgi:hypothetical protein
MAGQRAFGRRHGTLDRRLKQASEFPCEVHRDARVHCAFLVEEALRAAEAEYTFVPDVGVDVEPPTAVEAEADEALRRHVVARPVPEGPRMTVLSAAARTAVTPSRQVVVSVICNLVTFGSQKSRQPVPRPS